MAQPLRIGDAEREHAASALGEHYATGRLAKDEYEERAERVWAARFQADLEPLFADLPSPWMRAPAQARPARIPSAARGYRRPQRPAPLVPLLAIGLVAAAILTGAPWLLFGLFWVFALAGCGQRRDAVSPASRQLLPRPAGPGSGADRTR